MADVTRSAPHRVVVIGGGFAGLRTVQSLRHAPVDITLIDRRNFHLFQPLLYQVATGSLSPGEIATPLRAIFRRQRNVRVMLGEVTGIDAVRREVTVDRGTESQTTLTIGYDTLVVAAGMGNSYFGHDEWQDAAPALKSLENALDIRRRILMAFEAAETEPDPERRQEWLRFVVVGGGPTGVELAGQIGEIAADTMRDQFRSFDPATAVVTLVEGAPRILLAFDEAQAAHATRALGALGVTVRTDCIVSGVDADGVEVRHRGTAERIPARTVLWAAGVSAAPIAATVAAAVGITPDRQGRLPVAADLSVPGHPEIMVIGDLAVVPPPGAPGVAPAAMQMGRYAGAAIRGRLVGRTPAPFAYTDKGNLATIGRARAVADLFGMRFHGILAWWLWLAVHLFYLIGFQNRLLVLVRWSWSFLTRGRGARLITSGGDRRPDG